MRSFWRTRLQFVLVAAGAAVALIIAGAATPGQATVRLIPPA